MFDCIVPAAGEARRMGQAKQLMPLGGKPLALCAVERAVEAGCRCIVVTGAFQHEVNGVFRDIPAVELVHNPRYRDGMLSSLMCGVTRVQSEWFFVAPADMPALPKAAYGALAQRAMELGDERVAALFPRISGRRGHPVLIKRAALASPVVSAGRHRTMRSLLGDHVVRDVHIDPHHQGIFFDIDTPGAYRAASERLLD